MSYYMRIMKRAFCAVLALAMVLTGTGAALADGGELPPPAEQTEQGPAPEGGAAPQEPAPEGEGAPEAAPEPTEEPVMTEPPLVTAEPTPEPTVVPETPEPTEEPAADELETAAAGSGYDTEDPLYSKWMNRVSAIALAEESFSRYTPRALKGNEVLRRGIDVSVFQGSNINWSAVAADGIQFVFVRVAYRTLTSGELRTDTCYAKNLAGAKAAGLKVGAYIFSQAITEEEAREEARFLADTVSGYGIDLPLAFDFEYANGRLDHGVLTRQEGTDICRAFCDEVERLGYQSIVYSNPSMLSTDLYREQLGRLWLANYIDKTSYAGEYEYWQCGIGHVEGIAGDVDLDFWFDPSGKLTPPAQAPVSSPTPKPAATATPKPAATPTPSPAAPPPAQAPDNPFKDVKSGSWFYDSVLAAYRAGIVKGDTQDSFLPGGTATRGQVVTMVYRMAGEPDAPKTAAFTDLTADYYRDAVNWAAANNVVNGYTETTFAPNRPITRQQLAAILYRLSGSPAVSGSLSRYKDAASIQTYAQDAMLWAVQKGVINGYEDNTLLPGASATRAEVCAMLMRYQGQ